LFAALVGCTSSSSDTDPVNLSEDGTEGTGDESTTSTSTFTTTSTTDGTTGETTGDTTSTGNGTSSGGTGTDTGVTYECGMASAIELTPGDVASASASVFDPLPSDSPETFGFDGSDVRVVDFDTTPSGASLAADTELTDEYESLGVTMNNIRIDSDVFEGPASAPNATEDNDPQVFTFSVPVTRVGIVNTSPDQDTVQLWSGPDGTGEMLFEFQDQVGVGSPNFNIDRFVGVECSGAQIGSVLFTNASGDLELDDLVFEIAE
jgi:hypothetical protein